MFRAREKSKKKMRRGKGKTPGGLMRITETNFLCDEVTAGTW